MYKKIIAIFLVFVLLFLAVPAVSIPVNAENNTLPIKMLYIKTTQATDLIQRAKVDVGETYYFTFGLSNTVENFNVICRTDNQRRNLDANIQQVKKINKGNSTIYTYSYTIPETDKQGKAMTDLVFFGIKPAANSEGYFFGATLYNSKDTAKTELFTNPDFSQGVLNQWSWGWTWFNSVSNKTLSEWSNDTATLKIVDFDENLIKTMLHVRYESADMSDDILVQKIEKIEPDTEYTISFKYHFINGKLNETVWFALLGDDGDSSTIRTNLIRFSQANDYVTSTSDDGINVKYTFKLDSALTDKYESFYAGLYFGRVARIITEFYISDFVLYKTDDAEKNNLLEKKSFYEMGGWYSHWVVVKEGAETHGTETAYYLDYVAKYVPYDKELFIPEKDDVHYGDANFDGKITVVDLVIIKKNLVNFGSYISSFDCDSNKGIDANDLTILRKHLIGTGLIEWENTKSSLQSACNLSGGADSQALSLKSEIATTKDTVTSSRNTYYISQNGKYNNTGLSESNATTIEKLSEITLAAGDAVLFKRGETFRTIKGLSLVSDVSYGAYGQGDKPEILGSLKDYAKVNLWTTQDGYLWKTDVDALNAHNVVFNDGEYVGVLKNSLEEVNDDGEFYFDSENKVLYLYLRQYNPGNYFNSIEISSISNFFTASYKSNITIENLSLKYSAKHAINLISCSNVNIIGCEIGWIGGGFHSGTARFGNAIQLWDSASGCEIRNNHIYQVYDAALTFQGTQGKAYTNLSFNDNLIEYTSMNFEFWDDGYENEGFVFSNIDFTNNILRFAGYGFGGVQRTNKINQAYILSWLTEYPETTISDFNITENVFDIANCRFFYSGITNLLNISGNTYYQDGNSFYSVYSLAHVYPNDQTSFETAIKEVDSSANAYWLIH